MSTDRRRRLFQILTLAAAIVAYLTVVIGGDVRSSGAGMACGDAWPFCASGIIPDLSNPQIALEFTHRVVAFVTSLLILATLILAYLWYRKDLKTIALATASMVLLVAQVWLGMVTVATGLADPAVLTAHLAVGTATFATALALAVASLVSPPRSPSLHEEVDQRQGEEADRRPSGPTTAPGRE